MDGSSRTCPACQNVCDYKLTSEESNCCQSCGLVLTQHGFISDNTSQYIGQSVLTKDNYTSQHRTSQHRTTHHHDNDQQHFSQGKRAGNAFIRQISLKLNCSSSMMNEATSLFCRVFSHRDFHMRRLTVKRVLAACCVYITCRKHDWPLSVKDVSSTAKCSVSELNHWKNRVVER